MKAAAASVSASDSDTKGEATKRLTIFSKEKRSKRQGRKLGKLLLCH